MNTSQTEQTQDQLKQLFNLVAPIFICGLADSRFQEKAEKAWPKILQISPTTDWQSFGIDSPEELFENPAEWDISDDDDFNTIYYDFATDAYNALFTAIVNTWGDSQWEAGYDYWGAKGFKRPGETSKTFSISGDTSGFLPSFETADLLIARIKEKENESKTC